MVDRKTMIWAAAIAVAVIAAVVFALPGDEKKVKRQFARLCTEVNKSGDEGILGTALRARRTEALFAPTCTVSVAEGWINGESDPNTLVSQGFQARMQFRVLNLSFSEFNISFQKEGLATCMVVAKLAGTITDGTSVKESREMEWKLRKIGRDWLFESIREIEVIRK